MGKKKFKLKKVRNLEYINNIKVALNVFEKGSSIIPEDTLFRNILRGCTLLLRNNDFIVTAVPNITKKVRDTRGLIALFYNRLSLHHGDVVPYKEEKVDMSIAKSFVNKIMELTSFKRPIAIGVCANLIDVVFRHEADFNFRPGTLYSFRVFGQDNMSWVTEKALNIYNKERYDCEYLAYKAELENEKYLKTSNTVLGFGSNEEIKHMIAKINKEG